MLFKKVFNTKNKPFIGEKISRGPLNSWDGIEAFLIFILLISFKLSEEPLTLLIYGVPIIYCVHYFRHIIQISRKQKGIRVRKWFSNKNYLYKDIKNIEFKYKTKKKKRISSFLKYTKAIEMTEVKFNFKDPSKESKTLFLKWILKYDEEATSYSIDSQMSFGYQHKLFVEKQRRILYGKNSINDQGYTALKMQENDIDNKNTRKSHRIVRENFNIGDASLSIFITFSVLLILAMMYEDYVTPVFIIGIISLILFSFKFLNYKIIISLKKKNKIIFINGISIQVIDLSKFKDIKMRYKSKKGIFNTGFGKLKYNQIDVEIIIDFIGKEKRNSFTFVDTWNLHYSTKVHYMDTLMIYLNKIKDIFSIPMMNSNHTTEEKEL